jgi:hypothetical protein
MYQDNWMEPGVADALMPGDQVVARVYKVGGQWEGGSSHVGP